MDKQTKTFPCASFKVLDGDQGVVEAVVSVFGVLDSYGDRVQPGAFKTSLAAKLPKVCWAHQWDSPVGKTLAAEEWMPGDPRLPEAIRPHGGLWVKGQFNLETQRGREAFSDLKFGSVDEFSFGYFTVEEQRAKDGANELIALDIFEWSPVLIGANPATLPLSVKEPAVAPADTQPADPPAGTADDQLTKLLADAEAFERRQTEISALRAKEGRSLSAERREKLAELGARFSALAQAADEPKSLSPDAADALLHIYRERQRRRMAAAP